MAQETQQEDGIKSPVDTGCGFPTVEICDGWLQGTGHLPPLLSHVWDRPLLAVPTCALGRPWLSLWSTGPTCPWPPHLTTFSGLQALKRPIPYAERQLPQVLFKGSAHSALSAPDPLPPPTAGLQQDWFSCRAPSGFLVGSREELQSWDSAA